MSSWNRPIRFLRPWLPVLAAVCAGCAAPIEVVPELSPAPLPAGTYREAARAGAPVYEILREESIMLVRVGRAGRAKRLGHEHAVASEHLVGFVEFGGDPATARADIVFPLRELVVDNPEHRAHFALDTDPSEDDILGTYGNMLKVLEPDTYPWAAVHLRIASVDGDTLALATSVTVHGMTVEYLLPARIRVDGNRLTADADAVVKHSDFGLEPFSAAGGLLRVADELEVELHVVARRIGPQ